MAEVRTIKRAQADRRAGKSSSTQAGEFIREEMHHIREGKHGARSAKQAIAIGLSKARRSGVKISAPRKGRYSAKVQKQAKRDLAKGKSGGRKVSAKRSRTTLGALKQESRSAASHKALSKQARSAARRRSPAARSAAAKKAARTRKSERA